MLRYFKLITFIIAVFLFCRCAKKEYINLPFKGTYSGTFYYSNPSASFSPAGLYSAPVTVTFLDSNFACTSNPDQVPAGGSGVFKVSNQNVLFKDSNIWPANFNWGLILNGNYTYEIKSDSLILTKNTIYQYRLKRTN